ncbi:response regulator [Butyrivibrio sp. NC2002]|uniref:response regulator n=1 Tax=Butyrivibrio sp. NC2002 TaxID=1410610 RepID=UPI00055DF997|nr:response regulator [Butyrivibrio sp. NC2002]
MIIKKDSSKIIKTIMSTVILCILAVLLFITHVFKDNLVIDIYSSKVDLTILIAIGIAAFYGYFISLNIYLVIFLCAAIRNPESAFMLAPTMIIMFMYSMFSQYRWFRLKIRTIMAFVLSFMVEISLNVLFREYIMEYDFHMKKSEVIMTHIMDPLIANLFSCFFLYIFFKYFPDAVKEIFPLGTMYTRRYVQNLLFQTRIRKTRLSVKITSYIIIEALVLSICSTVFVGALFPDLRYMMNAGLDAAKKIDSGMGFRYNNYGLAFVIKMLFMELSIALPVAANLNYATKTRIGAPIGQLSEYMMGFTDTTDENRNEYLQGIRENPINTHDEITDLYYSLVITLNEVTGYIERMKEEQRLKEDLRVAQKASEAKSAFLSNMSHEIRTPINAVLGMNEMILRESNEKQTLEYASTIESAGNTLLSLVNDILDFSKIEAGKMEILPVQYNLSSTINDLVNMIAQRAQSKGLELKIEVDKELPDLLFGDEIRLKQCVTNILTNAVKYTQEGFVLLEVTGQKKDDAHEIITFRVVDTGIGIKEEDIAKLYSPFERIEEIRNRTIEGTGLGMSIVKKLLAMMDTRLVVKSVYGEGSDFSFDVEQEVVDWSPIGDFKERYKATIKERKRYKEKFHAPSAKILVVDDTSMNLTVIKGLLKKTLIQIDTAESGKETLNMVQSQKYDMIFLDHRMPEMDGIETLEAMKKLEGNLNKDTICIALTANAVSGAREMYIEAGFADYLAKPINAGKLEQMLADNLPKEKLIFEGDDGFETFKEPLTEKKEMSQNEKKIRSLKGIDVDEAISNAGDVDTLISVIEDFKDNIPAKLKKIREYEEAGDIKNYTIQVHALKSSARIIGASELSKLAGHLENCGNNGDEQEIKEKTPLLLELLSSYTDNLSYDSESSAGKDNSRGESAEGADNKKTITAEELENAYRDIKELMQMFDYDNANGICNMLKEYDIPEEYREKFDNLCRAMSAVDREKVLEII